MRTVRSRRWFFRILCLLILLLCARQFALPAAVRYLAKTRLAQQNPEAALYWLQWGETIGPANADSALLKCQVARRIGDPLLIKSSIEAARSVGVRPLRLEREWILYQAQSGEMSVAAPHLARLLTDETGDNCDVCISYIVGFLRNERYAEAETLINGLLSDAPEDAFGWYVRGRVFLHRQQLAKAEQDFRQSLTLNPGWSDPAIYLAELLLDARRPEEAERLFRNLQSDSEFGARAVVGLATCLKIAGNSQEAIALLRGGAVRFPADADLQIALGQSLFEEAEYAEAKNVLATALSLRPWADDALFMLAQSQRATDDPAAEKTFQSMAERREALQELDELESRFANDPGNESVRLRVGELLLRHRDPSDGIVVLQGILDKNPSCERAHEMIATFYETRSSLSETEKLQLQFHRQKLAELRSGQSR